MIRQEAILQSPLRILDRRLRGGLGKGHLGVITGPAGAGKSACLVQLGLDALLRERPVLHVAIGQAVEHVATRYDALFEELAERVDLADRPGVRVAMARRRLIWSWLEGPLAAGGLDEALASFQAHLGVAPRTVLVDGFDWGAPGSVASVSAFKESAARDGAELWMTARAGGLAGLPDGCAALVDVAISLEPRGRQARLTLVKDLAGSPITDVGLVIEGGALLRPPGDDPAPPGVEQRHAEEFTLLASGSAGAEEEFGVCAERWGLREVNFTFEGRQDLARTRGLVVLGEDDLKVGEVSSVYVKAHLRRSLPESAGLRRVLQTIWHQVSAAGEVFAIGTVNPDGSAQGGTGWAVELARHWGKPVHLFDQERGRWLRWSGRDWAAEEPPTITCERFAGAGTRSPSDAGREAIRALFERSFGAPPA